MLIRIKSRLFEERIAIIVISVAFGIYVAHAFQFGSWIVDDAGISFAYARSLGHGHGLVSQIGAIPVEGFSNPLWVFILAPFFSVGLFDPVVTPKIISALLVGGAYVLFYISIRRTIGLPWPLMFAILLLSSMNTSFVMWTVSGLENGLYVFLVAGYLFWICRTVRCDVVGYRVIFLGGAIAAGLALTRPEAIFFALVYPAVRVLLALPYRIALPSRELRRVGIFLLAFVGIFGAYMIFRILYFDDIVANTFYEKGGQTRYEVANAFLVRDTAIEKLSAFGLGIGGKFGAPLLIGLTIVVAYLAGRRRFSLGFGVLLLFTGVLLLNYLFLPKDWMPEFRFVTPIFPLLYAVAFVVIWQLVLDLNLGTKPLQGITAVLVVMVVVSSLILFVDRTPGVKSGGSSVSFETVKSRTADRYNEYASALGLEDGSLLTPDTGATFYYSDLRVFDLGGLADRVIAKHRRGSQRFFDYVFDEIKPTFIDLGGHWTYEANLESDPRFRQDYVPLRQHAANKTLFHGVFVRKTIAGENGERLSVIQDNP